jgi:hypothetical protein
MSQRAFRTIPLDIRPDKTEENLRSSKGIVFKRARVLDKESTTAAYVDSLIFDKRLLARVLITIKEVGGAESAYFKILGCIDPSDWHELQGETSLAAAGHTAYAVSDPYAYLKIQVKSNSGSATVTAFMAGLTP